MFLVLLNSRLVASRLKLHGVNKHGSEHRMDTVLWALFIRTCAAKAYIGYWSCHTFELLPSIHLYFETLRDRVEENVQVAA